MSSLQVAAPPVSRKHLRAHAQRLRMLAGLDDRPLVPVVELIEGGILDFVAPGFDWDVVDRKLLKEEHGLTLIQEKLILIREDVYEGAINGKGRDRFTITHELAHATLHSDVALARQAPSITVPIYRCPEWQANCFSGEFLIDHRQVVSGMTVLDVASEFGVSADAARFQLGTFIKDGFLTMERGLVKKIAENQLILG